MKFRKKPVVIEAVQFLGESSVQEMKGTWGDKFWDGVGFFVGGSVTKMRLVINTPEGTMTASIGDWIIKGVKGEFYPCKNDIFEATYEWPE